MSKYFIRDTESIKRAVWFVEKNNGVTVDDTYLQEWTELTEQYNENPSSELFMKLYYHYPSVMTLLRIIHPDDFDDVVVDTVVAKMEGKIMIGCINTTIVNHLVTLFANIMNWNSQSKELYVLCKCDSTDLKLSWKRVSQSFDLYLIGIFERITEKLLHMLEDTVDAKLFGKIVTELGKLPKYVPTFYAKNAYKRQASHTNNMDYSCNHCGKNHSQKFRITGETPNTFIESHKPKYNDTETGINQNCTEICLQVFCSNLAKLTVKSYP